MQSQQSYPSYPPPQGQPYSPQLQQPSYQYQSSGQYYQPQPQWQAQPVAQQSYYPQPTVGGTMMGGTMAYNSRSRTECAFNTKIVAILDMVVAVICMIGMLVVLGFGVLVARASTITDSDHNKELVKAASIMISVGLIGIICYIIDMVLAFGLIHQAGRQNVQPKKATRSAQIWLCFNIFLMILDFSVGVSGIFVKTDILFLRHAPSLIVGWGFLWFIVRIPFVAIVFMFLQRLKKTGDVGITGAGMNTATPSQIEQPDQQRQDGRKNGSIDFLN